MVDVVCVKFNLEASQLLRAFWVYKTLEGEAGVVGALEDRI